jgi:hypothetical protein
MPLGKIMPSENMKHLAYKSILEVEHFFDSYLEKENINLPLVFKEKGIWVAYYDDYSIGIFFLPKEEQQRIKNNVELGLPAFPSFFVSNQNKPENIPIGIEAVGTCNYFASNHSSNLIAFVIYPGASFTVVDHFHEIKDKSGNEFKYRVDLAFLLGTLPDEQWDKFKLRLLELLHSSMDVWNSIL